MLFMTAPLVVVALPGAGGSQGRWGRVKQPKAARALPPSDRSAPERLEELSRRGRRLDADLSQASRAAPEHVDGAVGVAVAGGDAHGEPPGALAVGVGREHGVEVRLGGPKVAPREAQLRGVEARLNRPFREARATLLDPHRVAAGEVFAGGVELER